nr:hypothetical protein [Tanacetum cinerariifolium]
KGKTKVSEEQVAHGLLSLQKHKKTSPTNQYIFQRRVSEPTGSSGHDESLYALLGQSDSEEESEKVMLGADEGGQDEGQARPDPGAQAEDQTRSDVGAQDEGQAGSNPDETSEGQAGPDPGDAGAKVQSFLSLVVHAGSDREHMDLDVADVSPQPSTEQLDKGFTATAYPKVQESLKLAVEEQVLLEEPASSSGTLSSLQHLSKDISFGDLFFSDRPSDANKNAEIEVESMQFKATTTDTTTTTTTTTLPPQALQQSNAEAMMIQRIGELEHIMANMIQVNKDMEESGTIRSVGSSWSFRIHPSATNTTTSTFIHNQESPFKGSVAPSSSKTAASAEYQAWTMTDVRLRPSITLTLADLEMDEDIGPNEQAQLSDDEYIGSAHIPKVNLKKDWWKPLEEERPATPKPAWSIPSSDTPTSDMATFIDWFCKRRGITELQPQYLEGPAFEIIKLKAAYYPDAGLEQMVPDQFWIDEECKYDIAVMYGISHWWFQRQRFYIDRHTSEGDRSAVRTQCGSSMLYESKFFLCHLNHLPPNDKKILTTTVNQWTIQLVIRQRVEDFQLGIESYQTQPNLTKPQWDATGFNDGTLQQIDEALNYKVKEFRINMINPGLNMRFWTRKDVDRCKAFMFTIQRRLRTRRIFHNLESIVGGRVREGDYRLSKRTE